MMKKIILLGPQGSGKSTQSKVIAEFLKIKIISIGNILREEIKNETIAGKKLGKYVNHGKLAPDNLILNVVFSRLPSGKKGFLLDGFPRDYHQALIFHRQFTIDKVFNLDIPESESIQRIVGRRVCANGHTWHIKYHRPKKRNVCDLCGEPLKQRADDKEKIVRQRLDIYRKETSKLLKYYHDQGKLVVFDGDKPIAKVSQDILDYLKKNAGQKNRRGNKNS